MSRLLAAALTVAAATALAVGAALGIVALLERDPRPAEHAAHHVRERRPGALSGAARPDRRPRRPRAPCGPMRSAWHDVPRLQVRQFAALAMAEAPVLAEEILQEIRHEYPQLPVVLDDSGEPMALDRHPPRHRGASCSTWRPRGGPAARPPGGLPGVRPRRGPERPQPRLAPGDLPARRPAGLAPVRRDRAAGRDPATRDVRTRRRRIRVPGRPGRPVRTRLRRGRRPAGRRAPAPPAPSDGAAALRAPPPGRPRRGARRTGRPHRLAAARQGRRRGAAAPRPRGRRARRGPGRAARHGVRAAPHGRARAGRRGPPRTAAPRADRLVRRDRPAGAARRRGEVAALGRGRGTAHGAAAAARRARCCTAPNTPRPWCCSSPRNSSTTSRCAASRPLAHCGPTHGRRLAETLLAWLETRGGAPEVAARLGVHPQTVRYRLRQIRELWGDEVDDPDRRFELELVLGRSACAASWATPAPGADRHAVRHVPLSPGRTAASVTHSAHPLPAQ